MSLKYRNKLIQFICLFNYYEGVVMVMIVW